MRPETIIETVYRYSEYNELDHLKSISATSLIGSKYKAWKILNNAPKTHEIEMKYLRSSTIGSAFHKRAETALGKEMPEIITETHARILVDDIWVTGTADMLIPSEDGYIIGDWKTGYGKDRTDYQLEKDLFQLSIYKLLFESNGIKIADKGYIFYVPVNVNNFEKVYTLTLDDYSPTDISDMLYSIEQSKDKCDCFDLVKYNPCNYCEFECEWRKES